MTRIGRLKRRAEFLAAAAANRKWVAPGLVLQAHVPPVPPESDDGDIRLGFTASRKVGNAVARNRAKRRLRALAVELLKDAPSPAQPTDLVLIARPATVSRDFAALRQDLLRGLAKLGVALKAGGTA
ncbi:MAG: ribonuclease P protein component [Rhodospirillaceae bacterium]|nr:ribonuclease P protein component [Rhodospirillaceae bacterium]